MNKIIFALPMTAAFLVFMGVTAQMNFAAAELNSSNTANKSKEEAMPLSGTKKILVAYFSHSGNTREIANQIHKIVGGDIFEIQAVKPYPNDYDAVVKQARQELDSGYKPPLKTKIEDIKSYDLIFIGYPNWWGTFPAPVKTFLSGYDFSGKTIVPFCTHGGSGLGRSVSDISKLCPKSTLLEGVAILGKDVKTAQNEVSEWLRKIKITK
jgi:flavodoxin